MSKYVIHYYNAYRDQNETMNIEAPNRFRAGRLFYRFYDRLGHQIDWIEYFNPNPYFWTQKDYKEGKRLYGMKP